MRLDPTPPVGSAFVIDGKELRVLDRFGCRSCYFKNEENGCNRIKYGLRLFCCSTERPDNTSVVFIEPHKYAAAKLLGETE